MLRRAKAMKVIGEMMGMEGRVMEKKTKPEKKRKNTARKHAMIVINSTV